MKKKKTKFTMVELSREIGVNPDTLYKSKRRCRCSVKVSVALEGLTGIPASVWAGLRQEKAYSDPWGRILKDG